MCARVCVCAWVCACLLCSVWSVQTLIELCRASSCHLQIWMLKQTLTPCICLMSQVCIKTENNPFFHCVHVCLHLSMNFDCVQLMKMCELRDYVTYTFITNYYNVKRKERKKKNIVKIRLNSDQTCILFPCAFLTLTNWEANGLFYPSGLIKLPDPGCSTLCQLCHSQTSPYQ